MDRILKILKKENGPRASSAPALELNTIIFKHVYWYMQQISGERLQDHWSSGLSLVSLLWDIGKQYSPRCDAAECGVPSGAILFAERIFIEKLNKILKITPDASKNESGLTQMIMMGKSIRQIWVKGEWAYRSVQFDVVIV